jgi:hypothetical protein
LKRGKLLTICIAAIGSEQKNEFIVFATDHMVSMDMGENGVWKFEHAIEKYKSINSQTIAMIAGVPLFLDQLTKNLDDKVQFNEISLEIYRNFLSVREDLIHTNVFNVLGVNREFFIERLKEETNNSIIEETWQKILEYNLQTSILLIGFVNNEAMITEIHEKGFIDFRQLNFHAIGSGAAQAQNTLLFQKHSKKDCLEVTIYDVYKAKRNAEVSEGVGRETDLGVLTKRGFYILEETKLDELDKIYQDELKYGRTHQDLLKLKSEIKLMSLIS